MYAAMKSLKPATGIDLALRNPRQLRLLSSPTGPAFPKVWDTVFDFIKYRLLVRSS